MKSKVNIKLLMHLLSIDIVKTLPMTGRLATSHFKQRYVPIE